MAAMMQTVPLFSKVFALLLLHDSMTLVQAVGGFLALLGGMVISLSSEASTPVTPTSEVLLPDGRRQENMDIASPLIELQ